MQSITIDGFITFSLYNCFSVIQHSFAPIYGWNVIWVNGVCDSLYSYGAWARADVRCRCDDVDLTAE
jgi:hypothetical protein